ncbi:radical SAM protein [Vibrio sp. 2art]|uniref:radical SAM protein n=1 Tax=Vibrio sp. 2art TaxID=2998832 RepID=UPI0022CDA030|nr:radical SAM protein [Vibrio sp. 2art]MDA0111951.1 radical SAM protein [Vibrio sp. 2art]
MHIFWDFTKHCNLNCIHCYNAKDREIGAEDSTLKSQLELIDSLCERYPRSTLHFLGGEPLISPNFSTVFEYAHNKGFKLEVTTNGTVSNPKLVDLVATHSRTIHLSLDSTSREINDKIRGRNVFNKVEKFLSLIRKYNYLGRINLSFTLTKLSIMETDALVEYCLKNGILHLTISPIKLLGNATITSDSLAISAGEYITFVTKLSKRSLGERIDIRVTGGSMRLKEHIKWNYYTDIVSVEKGCNAGTGQLRISWDGVISPCIMANGSNTFASSSKWRAETGSDIVRIVNSHEFDSFSKTAKNITQTEMPNICISCEYHSTGDCFAGCGIQKEYGSAKICEELKGMY